jgi:hypothetical protein
MEEENSGLRAVNVELISRMDMVAGQMELMQMMWNNQGNFVNHSVVEGLIHVLDRHCQPKTSVQSPIQRVLDARRPIPDVSSRIIPAMPTRPMLPRGTISFATPAPTIVVEVATRPIIPPRGTIIYVPINTSTSKTAPVAPQLPLHQLSEQF